MPRCEDHAGGTGDHALTRIFVVSDTHFGHDNMMRFLREDGTPVRPFPDRQTVDDMMVERWNSTVNDDDIVYHLGDVYFGHGHTVLGRLKGRKRLILGNHDNGKSEHIQRHFQKVLMWRMFPEYNCLLTHVPVHESSMHKVGYNLHGHIHQQPSPGPRYVNCCVEVQDYTPRLITDLVPMEVTDGTKG